MLILKTYDASCSAAANYHRFQLICLRDGYCPAQQGSVSSSADITIFICNNIHKKHNSNHDALH